MKPKAPKKRNPKPQCKGGEVKEVSKKYKDYSNPNCKCGDMGDIKSVMIFNRNDDGSLGEMIYFKDYTKD